MTHRTLLLTVATVCLSAALACGGNAVPVDDEGAPQTPVAASATVDASAGIGDEAGQPTRGRGRAESGLEVVILTCGWVDGDDLRLEFSIENTEDELRFGNFRLQNTTGSIYRPPGVKSDISIPTAETREYSVNTDTFPRGPGDVSLVVSDGRRESHTVPLEKCD